MTEAAVAETSGKLSRGTEKTQKHAPLREQLNPSPAGSVVDGGDRGHHQKALKTTMPTSEGARTDPHLELDTKLLNAATGSQSRHGCALRFLDSESSIEHTTTCDPRASQDIKGLVLDTAACETSLEPSKGKLKIKREALKALASNTPHCDPPCDAECDAQGLPPRVGLQELVASTEVPSSAKRLQTIPEDSSNELEAIHKSGKSTLGSSTHERLASDDAARLVPGDTIEMKQHDTEVRLVLHASIAASDTVCVYSTTSARCRRRPHMLRCAGRRSPEGGSSHRRARGHIEATLPSPRLEQPGCRTHPPRCTSLTLVASAFVGTCASICSRLNPPLCRPQGLWLCA